MKWMALFLLILVTLFLISCSSDSVDKNTTLLIKDDNPTTDTLPIYKKSQISSQPLIYLDDTNISQLESGYGTFGIHAVETKTIQNSEFPARTTTLYYPKDLNKSLPTLFFYAGAGVYHADTYKGLFYFVASKGYNILFITYENYQLRPLPAITRDAINQFSSHIDKSKVGFLGHSMGAGVTFWLINQLTELGSDARIIFPMASGYSAFNVKTNMIPHDKTIQLPDNTKMILQVYAKDYTTDIRIGIDLFLNNSIAEDNKTFMFIYGDKHHAANHSSMATKDTYHYDAFMQRTIYRPLDALMDEAFNHNLDAKTALQEQSANDPYFHPYIGLNPQLDIDKSYIFPEDFYPFNCSEAKSGHYISIRKEYCKALEL